MKYDDLPYQYREYAEQRGWDEKQALHYWQSSKEFRGFVEREILSFTRGQLSSLEPNLEKITVLDSLLMRLRGRRIELS